MTNFDFLRAYPQFESFAETAVAAERVLHINAATCALTCRRAMEAAVKWMYSVDGDLAMPYDTRLVALMGSEEFRELVGTDIWRRMEFVRKVGNNAAHGESKITREQAELCLENLFYFMDFVACCYVLGYEGREFDFSLIAPLENAVIVDANKLRKQPGLAMHFITPASLDQLMEQNAPLREEFTARREAQQPLYVPKPLDMGLLKRVIKQCAERKESL